jgi:hypothetical protein
MFVIANIIFLLLHYMSLFTLSHSISRSSPQRNFAIFFQTDGNKSSPPESVPREINTWRREIIRGAWAIAAIAMTTSLSTAVLAQDINKNLWSWIFERNAQTAKIDPDAAKLEKTTWKNIDGMMDAYDEWLENKWNLLQAKATESEQKKNQTWLIRAILESQWDMIKQEEIRKKFIKNDYGLSQFILLKDFCDDYKAGRCPPIWKKHLLAIQEWNKII